MDPIPTRIGDYEPACELGRGGMGVVYLARQRSLGRFVALKVLPREFTSDATRLRRFHLEAEAISRLDHPNIVPIHDVGEDAGLHYIAMKYIPGIGLDGLIRAQRAGATYAPSVDETLVMRAGAALTPARYPAAVEPGASVPMAPVETEPLSGPQWTSRILRAVEKIARALDHAHACGIIHRDVKPANILLDRRGDPWLLDFGLVRDTTGESLSESAGVLGTAQYMPPEQVRGRRSAIDHRSDLYALGVTLYELMTLKRPFHHDSIAAILHAVVHDEPVAPRIHNPEISADLETVILKAMEKDPERRYQSGDAFADDLRRVRNFQPVRAQPVSRIDRARRFCTANPLIAAALLFAALSFAGLVEFAIYRARTAAVALADALEDANAAFTHGNAEGALVGYRVYVRMGGDPVLVAARIDDCRRQLGAVPGVLAGADVPGRSGH